MSVDASFLSEKADALIKTIQDDEALATRIEKEIYILMKIIVIENKSLQFERQRNLDLQNQLNISSRNSNASTEDKEELGVVIQNVKNNIDNLDHSSQELDNITKIIKEQVSRFLVFIYSAILKCVSQLT
jgi:hypothetical protein